MKPYKVEKPEHISGFAKEFDFESLRPFYDSEVKSVMERVSQDPTFHKLVNSLWPELTKEQAIKQALETKSICEFQVNFMAKALWQIVKTTSTGLTYNGIENINPNKSYLFIANHRDILLDSALMGIILVKEGFSTPEITFGDNLNAQGFITDFGKLNRMFPIKREGTTKELYQISQQLSAYLRHTIIDKKSSVWISQRNGRTKDGHDVTQSGVLKMLSFSGSSDFVSSFAELNILPVTISYEYEPCDGLKINELYQTEINGKYTKAPGEDLNNILTGIKQPKGRIHLSFGTSIGVDELKKINTGKNENENLKFLAEELDKQIYRDYVLYENNYIAADVVNNNKKLEKHYTEEQKNKFIQYVSDKISMFNGDKIKMQNMFYQMYAAPVHNKIKTH